MSRVNLPSEKMEVTIEDFAKWLLQLPDEIKTKQIWYIDLGTMWKGKPVNFEHSPTGAFVGLDEMHEEEGK